jgi:hypothetical protein
MIVEDNTGLSDAESYVSVDECLAYFEKYGGGDTFYRNKEKQKEQSLRRATQIVDSLIRWNNVKYKETQALEFPRQNDRVEPSNFIPVPKKVKSAVCEIADLYLKDDLRIVPLKSEKYGDTTVTYAQPYVESKMLDIKRSLLDYGGYRSTIVTTYRA